MQKIIGFGFLVVLVAVLVAVAGWQRGISSPMVTPEPSPLVTLEPDLKKHNIPVVAAQIEGIEAPRVEPMRLMADVAALAGERYEEEERQLARKYIISQLRSAGWEPQQQEFEEGMNIYADRPGADPQAGAILVGAHYDTVALSPGADDNATGVAAVLEIARLLGKQETARGLRVAFFDSEEVGLFGSMEFAATPELTQDLRGVIIADMLGYACHTAGCQSYPVGIPAFSDKGDFLAAIGDTEHLPLLQAFQGEFPGTPPVFSLPVPFKGMLAPDTMRSDHAPFWYQNMGAVLLTDTANFRNPHYHEPTDITTSLDRPFFFGAVQLMVNGTTALLGSTESLVTPELPPTMPVN
ncbi:MAG TPA: M28 family peptidase [Oscillatoriaceae cyanobacterium M33_DOE_052]|uniref:M28 family peptidase n=1 Tax=Planktothricoides sp. SpSt-374 TaxID=2282167 RepID=A0A7C3ZQK9_9CYAN|nr:M28 family peptidase [Oscillatoriaceae cyanobacterium M33_DOE_052]